ncbi:MAG: MarR family transcriptional regulator [Micrococcales bacterium]|uniref:MarR family winged helix-turn-helix transcriptional regulator n=1 Tax=Cellulomonas sp. P4 TaxID=3142533 RepID=UPI0019A0482C|nr:MarR family transcriptional regulator [Micrococcales bacterium]
MDTPTDPVVRLEAELGLLLRRARASAERLAREVHPDLEPSAYPLLARIEREPDVRASELAEHIGVGRGTMSRQLGRIEQLGLIERRPDPEDSRGQLIRVTPEGARRVDAARVARRRYLGQVLDGWTATERGQLADQLHRLNEDLSTTPRTPPAP